MDTKLDNILNKLEKIEDSIVKIDTTLTVQQVILEEHQKRSLANEKAVEVLATEFRPIRDQVIEVRGIGKSLKFLFGTGLLGLVLEVIRLFS